MGRALLTSRPQYPFFLHGMADKPVLLESVQRVLDRGARRFYTGHGGPLLRQAVARWLERQRQQARSAMSKVILIIGATRGVGLVIANRLHQAGYRVLGTGCNPNPAVAPFPRLPLNVGNEAAMKVSIYLALAPESSDLNRVVIAPSGKVTRPPKAVLDPALAQREWQWNGEVAGLSGQRHEHCAPVVAVGQLASAHWL